MATTPTVEQSEIAREGGYVFRINVWSDHQVVVSMYNQRGFHAYSAEARIHPSEQSADTISRLIDRIEDEYVFPANTQEQVLDS